MLNLTPFVPFDGNGARAMGVLPVGLGGELAITTVGDMSMKARGAAQQHRKVAHGQLKIGAVEFSATDWQHLTRTPRQGTRFAMYTNGGTFDQLNQIFGKLSEGANKELLDPLQDPPFGTDGHLADNYGVHLVLSR